MQVDVEGLASVKGSMGSDRVEELPVALRLDAEVVAVVDLVAVEVFVLQRLKMFAPPLDRAIRLQLKVDLEVRRRRLLWRAAAGYPIW